MKQRVVALLVVLTIVGCTSPVIGQRCKFSGPQDSQTLRGNNFLTNVGSGTCLRVDRVGGIRLPVKLNTCSWNNVFPPLEQMFGFWNHNGGSTVKPKYEPNRERCLSIFGGSLVATTCIPKNDDQTWIFNHVRSGLYQMMKRSNRRCLRAQSKFQNSLVIEGPCNPSDNMQLWRICTK